MANTRELLKDQSDSLATSESSESSSSSSPEEKTDEESAVALVQIPSKINPLVLVDAEDWVATVYVSSDESKIELLVEGVSPENEQVFRNRYYLEYLPAKNIFKIETRHDNDSHDFSDIYYSQTPLSFEAAMAIINNIQAEKSRALLQSAKHNGGFGSSQLSELMKQYPDLSFFSLKHVGNKFNKKQTRFNWCLKQIADVTEDEQFTLEDSLSIDEFKIRSAFIPAATVKLEV